MRLGATALARRVQLRLAARQAAGAAALADRAALWALRSRYAALRPTGWRSQPGTSVPWWCGRHAPSVTNLLTSSPCIGAALKGMHRCCCAHACTSMRLWE